MLDSKSKIGLTQMCSYYKMFSGLRQNDKSAWEGYPPKLPQNGLMI